MRRCWACLAALVITGGKLGNPDFAPFHETCRQFSLPFGRASARRTNPLRPKAEEMSKNDVQEAAEVLRRVLTQVKSGQLSAEGRRGAPVVNRLRGAVHALDAVARTR